MSKDRIVEPFGYLIMDARAYDDVDAATVLEAVPTLEKARKCKGDHGDGNAIVDAKTLEVVE